MRTTASSSPSISGGMSGRGYAEILEVGGREHQHLAGAVVAEVVVALPGTSTMLVQRRKSSFSSFGFWVNRL